VSTLTATSLVDWVANAVLFLNTKTEIMMKVFEYDVTKGLG
jgi:hypothetical protein